MAYGHEVTRRNTRTHFVAARIMRDVGDGLALEGAAAADLVTSIQVKSDPVARKGHVA
jgi:hypothetical protein